MKVAGDVLFHQQMLFEFLWHLLGPTTDVWVFPPTDVWVPYLDLKDVVDSMSFHFSVKHRKDGSFKVLPEYWKKLS